MRLEDLTDEDYLQLEEHLRLDSGPLNPISGLKGSLLMEYGLVKEAMEIAFNQIPLLLGMGFPIEMAIYKLRLVKGV